MPTTIDDARQLVEARLADIAAEVKTLERALASLGEGSAKRRPGRPSKRTAVAASPMPKRRASRKRKSANSIRAPRGQRREQLLAAIKADPGARPANLAKAIDVNPAQVHALIRKARADKLLVKEGKGYRLNSRTKS